MAVFILFSFGQFALRGFVDLAAVPVWIHLHALVMLGWLGLFMLQPTLIRSGDLRRHRQFGALAIGFAVTLVCLGGFSALMSVRTGHVPSFFSPSYFLALNFFDLAAFALMVGAAVHAAVFDRTAHPRLIVGANVLLLDPALGRLLPMPLIQPWGEFVAMVIQLGVLALVARHDRARLGYVHRATLAGMAVVALAHTLTEMVGHLPALGALATALAPAG
ncbi:hypothetical protein MTR62_15395 [Novosphingobium sp. 1949]|uniref:Adenylate cyclase n=1 Tax=Novosphingobium organovorum TaxID=2930092 RepID=A0ABT0BGB5_9SPHN|nr:hypothetical protein [Novosphingobium organovorum]MCJ2184069.1 hypothetical protein [Novosphingobium organovorum]